MNKTVVVGMSGGVDSSVTALLLKQQGFKVIGLFMKNWEEKDDSGVCLSAYDYEDVRRVCETIDIPYYAVNFAKEYRDKVFNQFIEDFKKGLTPNPDILCNREIKFKVFFDKAMELGADYLATGHYCQNIRVDGRATLVKGADAGKDQTYFLYTMKETILEKVLFPIGGIEKKEVRSLARVHNLATSEKKDSTGICFIGERHFRSFLSEYVAMQPGNFETLDGKVVGKHTGAAYYTLGQRKGMGIGGAGDAWFVVGKDMNRGVVHVAQGTDHPALYCDELVATELTWVGDSPPTFPFSCNSKIRYRQADESCVIERIQDGKAYVTFPRPQRAVTPGQSIVFYNETTCLGGGVIQEKGPSYYELKRPLLDK
jgi:tRNA-specific 2-thiouridylase